MNDKKLYELNIALNELVVLLILILIGYILGITAGSIQNKELQNELKQYKFNEYVVEQSLNDEGFHNKN